MSIFVGNLPFRSEREDVLQLFTPFGEVINCSLPLERDTGRKRGFAFVEMADEAIESTAIEGLQGTELMGRPLRINKAEPRGGGGGGSRRGGRGGGYGGGGNSEPGSNYTNKSSGAEGWEDRSYGNSTENSEYESGRSRRRRGVSNDGGTSNEDS